MFWKVSRDSRRIVELRESPANGVRYLTQHAALAVYYAFAVAHLIEGAIRRGHSEGTETPVRP
jgi:hypothetical protein